MIMIQDGWLDELIASILSRRQTNQRLDRLTKDLRRRNSTIGCMDPFMDVWMAEWMNGWMYV